MKYCVDVFCDLYCQKYQPIRSLYYITLLAKNKVTVKIAAIFYVGIFLCTITSHLEKQNRKCESPIIIVFIGTTTKMKVVVLHT